MKLKGQKTFRRRVGTTEDHLNIQTPFYGVRIAVKTRIVRYDWEEVVVCFSPKKTRAIAKALNRAADTIEANKSQKTP